MVASALSVATGPVQNHFSPYSSQGGTVVAVSGSDYAIIASDTRLSEGFNIHSRNHPKTYKLGENILMGSAGFHGDALTLTRNIQTRMKMYEHAHKRTMNVGAVAQMLSNTLYYKRFFPYYVYNIIAGIAADGTGAVYSYDPVGCYERERYSACGSSERIIQPFLDNQIGRKNIKEDQPQELTREQCAHVLKDAFISAAERDIETGDGVLLCTITKDGIEEELFPLRRD